MSHTAPRESFGPLGLITKMRSKSKIYLSSPHMGGREQSFVNQAFETNWVAPLGANVDGFESDISKYVGVAAAAALSSGTAAIHLALIILGVKPGDEVLVSTFTFSGSVNPILYVGAAPVMVESEPATWNIDPQALKEAIEDRKKLTGKVPGVLILVHLYGMPARLDEILEICREYGIFVIEDAAEALGSRYKGKKSGSFGDLGIFSFNGNKIITTSGGGALVSDNAAWIESAKFLAAQARDPGLHYQHSRVGFNYRMSNLLAGVGRGQMRVLDNRVAKRREINQFYRELMPKDCVCFLTEPGEDYFSNHWLTALRIKPESGVTNEDLRLHLHKENIEARPVWKPMHLQPIFEKYPYYGNRWSEKLFEEGLCLPSGSNMTEENYHRIRETIYSFFHSFG